MIEKSRSNRKDWLISTILIVTFAVDMAFVEDKTTHFCILALIWSYFVISRRRIQLDIGDVLIFFGMLSFMWIWDGWFLEAVVYALKVTVAYQIGKCFVDPNAGDGVDRDRTYNTIVYTILMLALAFYVRGALNFREYVRNIPKMEEMDWLRDEWNDMFGSEIVRTHQAFYLLLMGSILIYWIIILVRKKYYGVIGILLSISAIFMDLFAEGRIVFGCSLLAFIASVILIICEKKIYRSRWFLITIGVLVCGIITITVGIRSDMGELNDRYAESFWMRGGGFTDNVRFHLMKQSFLLLREYPFGRCSVPLISPAGKEYDYAHNAWLDIGRRGGLLPFLLTVAFTITNIASLCYVWKKNKNNNKYIIISAFIGTTLYSMLEPSIIANMVFWNTEVFLGGMAMGLYEYQSGKKGLVIDLR